MQGTSAAWGTGKKRRWNDRSSRENIIEEGNVPTQKVLKKARSGSCISIHFHFHKMYSIRLQQHHSQLHNKEEKDSFNLG